MTALAKFLEKIDVAGKTLGYQAYRMDGNSPKPDMRKYVGLGTCNCCDYFMFSKKENITVLIEETKLNEQIKDLKGEYRYFEVKDLTEFVRKYIRNENKLKVYGSMLVLCRLATACKNVTRLLQTKKYKFWLVVSDERRVVEDAKWLDHLTKDLKDDLKSVLSKKLVDDVKIIPSGKFVEKLSQYATLS